MAYFKCAFSNNGATLTVECDSFMAGAIVTCSNGVKTLQGLCPSTSPYEVTFKIPEDGTWVVSTTISGATYSTSVDIDFTFEASLSGFNWMRWLTEGGLDPSDYNDLSEVLADEKALRQLNLVHASVDYMASIIATHPDVETIIAEGLFAKWANLSDYALDHMEANAVLSDLMDDADLYGYGELIEDNGSYVPKGNVPVMTSDTAPYGEASCSPSYSQQGWGAYNSFNEDTSKCCLISGTSGSIQYKFANPVAVKRISIKELGNEGAVGHASLPKDVEFYTSNDGSSWNKVGDETIATSVSGETYEFEVENEPQYCLYFKINALNNHGTPSYTEFGKVQFYGRELKVSVPTMTSNTAPYGEATSSSEYSTTYPTYKAFDKNNSTYWSNAYQSGDTWQNTYLGYRFGHKIKLGMVVFKPFKDSSGLCLEGYAIKGTNDGGSTWDTLATGNVSTDDEVQLVISSEDTYDEIRLVPTSQTHYSAGINAIAIRELQFYGKDYSEKEFANDGSKWLYDHGVELEEMDGDISHSGFTIDAIVKNPDSVTVASVDSGHACALKNKNLIDLTSYELIRARTQYKGTAVTYFYSLTTSTTKDMASYDSSTNVANMLDAGHDITNVNGNHCVLIYCNNGRAVDVTELWLE